MRWAPAAAWLGYALAVLGLAGLDGAGFDEIELVPTGSPGRRALVGVALALGLPLAFLLPGAAWLRGGESRCDWLLRCFVASLLIQALLLSLLKLGGLELGRSSWLACVALCLAPAWARAARPPPAADPRLPGMLAAALGLGLLLGLFFRDKIFLESFTGDGVEHFEFARSLTTHLLPTWDLENGRWGTYPSFFFFAYPSLLTLLCVGPVEAAVRLPALVFTVATALLLGRLAVLRSPGPDGWAPLLIAAALALLWLFHGLYSTWHPFFADLAEPTGCDLVVIFFGLAALYALLQRRMGEFVLCGLLASWSHVNGVVLVGLAAAAAFLQGPDRLRLLRTSAVFAAAALGPWGLLQLATPDAGAHQYRAGQLAAGWLEGGYGGLLPDKLAWIALSTGAVWPIGSLRFGGFDRDQRLLMAVAGLYTLLVLLAPRSHPHYTLALSVLLLPGFVRGLAWSRHPRRWRLGHLAAVAAAGALITPLAIPVDRTAQRVGARIAVEGRSYRERVAVAPMLYEVLPFDRYGVTHHSLLPYARTEATGEVDWCIARRLQPPEGFEERARQGGVGLFARPGAAYLGQDLAPQRYGRALPLALFRMRHGARLAHVRDPPSR